MKQVQNLIGGFFASLFLIWPLEQRMVHNYPLLHVMRTQEAAPKLFQVA